MIAVAALAASPTPTLKGAIIRYVEETNAAKETPTSAYILSYNGALASVLRRREDRANLLQRRVTRHMADDTVSAKITTSKYAPWVPMGQEAAVSDACGARMKPGARATTARPATMIAPNNPTTRRMLW